MMRTNKARIILAVILIINLLSITANADSTSKPTLILESYSIEGSVTSGEDFVIQYVIKNTSRFSACENILLSWVSAGYSIYPSYGRSNQQYVENIEPGGTYAGAMEMSVKDGSEPGVYAVALSISYQGPENNNLTSDATIVVQVKESGALTINSVSLASECIVGRQTFISVRYENAGSDEARNAKVIIEGDVGESEKTVSLGTIKANATNAVERYITFQSEGNKRLDISIAFEDKEGQIITTPSYIIETKAVSPGASAEAPSEGDQSGQGGNFRDGDEISDSGVFENMPVELLIVGGAAALIIIAFVVVVILRARKRKR